MIETFEPTILKIATAFGEGNSLFDLSLRACMALPKCEYGAVICASFSNQERFPALAIKIASALNLPLSTPAFDINLACSAYPYAIYLANMFARETRKPVLVVDGDVQTPFVDANDSATNKIFSNAASASVVSAESNKKTFFDFYSSASDVLTCSSLGPIKMDGFAVFTFVATEVKKHIEKFGNDFDFFAPHQANPYMIRQLARSLSLSEKLLTIDEKLLNTGSCSIAIALEGARKDSRVLISGFGAGLSIASGIVRISSNFQFFKT